MLTTLLQGAPYLPRQRNFPANDPDKLGVVLDKSYIEIASRVNERTIGIFALNFPSVTGESWYLAGNTQKQQTLRQVYQIPSSGTVMHGITTTQITGFTRIYGTFTDGTNWYPLPYVSSVAATSQVQVMVTPTTINVTRGAGAPAFVSGTVVLEWLANI